MRAQDPDRVAACVRMFDELPEALKTLVASKFVGKQRSPENDAAWCRAVEAAYYKATPRAPAGALQATEVPAVMAPAMRMRLTGKTAPAGTAAPFFGDINNESDCRFNEVNGFRWDSTQRRCVPDDATGPAPTQSGWGWGTSPTPTQPPIASDDDCRARGGFVMGFGDGRTCSFVDGPAVPIGPRATQRPDNTPQVIAGIVTGAVGIANVVSQIIGRQDQQEFQQFMLGLQAEQRRLDTQSRQGDRDAALALARIQQAITESQTAAAQANADAARANQPAPFPPELLAALQKQGQVPAWAWVLGGVGVVAIAVLVLRPQQPQPQLPAGHSSR